MIDVGTVLCCLDVLFDGSCYRKRGGLFLGASLVSTDVKVLGYDEGIKLVLYGGKLLGTVLGNVYETILGLDFRTELVSLDG